METLRCSETNKALGFDPNIAEHIKMLEEQIYFDPSSARFTKMSSWGHRYDQNLTIAGPNGKIITGVRVIWQRHHITGIMELLTILPSKKSRQRHV